jgi:hypothetical protein
MPLIATDSPVPLDTLRRLYDEHREGIGEVADRLDHPEVAVVDLPRWMLARDLARDSLKLLPDRSATIEDRRVIEYVNVTYDLMIVLIESMKGCLDLSKVPRRRP